MALSFVARLLFMTILMGNKVRDNSTKIMPYMGNAASIAQEEIFNFNTSNIVDRLIMNTFNRSITLACTVQ